MKPREWEIATHHNASGHFNPIVNGPKTSGEEMVKVIEKSEYDLLLKDAEELVKALEFFDGVHRLHWAVDLNKLPSTAETTLAAWNAKYGSKK